MLSKSNKKRLKKINEYYQLQMWYIAQFGGEISKPMRFYPEMILSLGLLALYGVKFEWFHIVLFYIGILIFARMAGYILVRWHVIKFNTTLANKQNPELLRILKSVQKIRKDIKYLKIANSKNTWRRKSLTKRQVKRK